MYLSEGKKDSVRTGVRKPLSLGLLFNISKDDNSCLSRTISDNGIYISCSLMITSRFDNIRSSTIVGEEQ